MRSHDRVNYLKRAPVISSNILCRGRYDFTYDLMPVHAVSMPLKKRVNLLRAGANLLYRRLHPWSWPIHIHIELASYCNLKCKVCPTGTGRLERKPAAMEPALFERLMDEIGPYLLTTSLWGWGESLLHPRLSDILRIAQNRGITTLMSTNGQNLNDEKVQQALIDYPPNYLIVALDGITDETHSRFRVGARVENALEGVRSLAGKRLQKGAALPVLHLRYIVMKHNEHELPQLPEFAKDNQFDELSIRTLSIIDAPEDIHHPLIPDNETLRAYSYKDGTRVRRTDFICEKIFIFPAVFSDGTVVACDQDCNARQPIGSIADGSSFADVWWGERAAEVRKAIRDNPESFSFCRNCPFKDRPISTCNVEYYNLRK